MKELIIVLAAIMVGIVMIARAVETRTAFVWLMSLITVMSFILAANPANLTGVAAITTLISLVILVLDGSGVLT